MTPDLRARTNRRTEATQRRAELTAATAVIGIVATAGFGWLAAETYAGTPKADTSGSTNSTTTVPEATQPSTVTNPYYGGSTNDGTTRNRSGSSSSGSSISGSSSSGITRGTGRAHVSSGSS